MAAFSDLLGSVITGTANVLLTREQNKELARQYENDALRASITKAEEQRQRELGLLAAFQERTNMDKAVMVKIVNVLLITVAASLMGVLFFNFSRRRKG